MLDPGILYDPNTKKCCVKRCTKVASMIDTALTGIQLDVVSQLSSYAKQLEEQISETTTQVCKPINEAITKLEEQVKQLYETIQSPLLSEYGRIRHGIESAIGDSSYQYDSPGSSPIPTVETEDSSAFTDPARFAYDSQGQVIQLAAEVENVGQTPTTTELPSSSPTQTPIPSSTPTPSQLLSSAAGVSRKPAKDCVEIDLCGELRLALQPLGRLVNLVSKVMVNTYPAFAVQVLQEELGTPEKERDDDRFKRPINDRMGYHVEPNPALAADESSSEE